MMDLYEAIENVENWIEHIENQPRYIHTIEHGDEALEAIKICLEAARDKAGV